MTTSKEVLRRLRQDCRELESQMLGSIKDKLKDFHALYVIGTLWDCPDSPFGLCVYHHIEDRAHDDCVFCHDPAERK